MQEYNISTMKDFSKHYIDQIRILEHLCKTSDRSSLRVGVESLKEIDGDEAFLCQIDNQLVGFLSWYTSDVIEANINGMVHPDFRRQGVFHDLLKSAAADMQMQGIQTCRFRIPSNSESGMDYIRHLGASAAPSEFLMVFNRAQIAGSSHSGLVVRLEEDQDLEFMVKCSSQAFGDSESWTRNYLTRTRESARITYIAVDNMIPVGMIRVNDLDTNTAVIHDFCVLPSCQGRGYGREILSEVVKILRDQKNSQIRLSVVTQNRNALSLYQSVGFEVTAEFNYYVISVDMIC